MTPIDAAIEAMEVAATDLEHEIRARHGHPDIHPAMIVRYERDMEVVDDLRTALAGLREMRERAIEGWVDPNATGLTHSYMSADFWLETPDKGQNTVPAILIPTPERTP